MNLKWIICIAVMLEAVNAQACQLICVKTTAVYNGNLGGVSGADAKCEAELGTGWKFPRVATIPLAMGTDAAVATSGGYYVETPLDRFTRDSDYYYDSNYSGSGFYGWLGATRSGNNLSTTNKYDCAGWTNSGYSQYGGAVQASSGGSQVGTPPCAYVMPLICCNM